MNELHIIFAQGDHLSGKTGNVREFVNYQGNARKLIKT